MNVCLPSDKKLLDLFEHFDNDIEVWPLHRITAPTFLHNIPVLIWAFCRDFRKIRPCLLVHYGIHDFMWPKVLEGRLSRHDLPHDYAIGVDICFMSIVTIALENLGGHPVESTCKASHRDSGSWAHSIHLLDGS